MKKGIALIIVLFILFTFVGCTNEVEDRDLPINHKENHIVSGNNSTHTDTQSSAESASSSQNAVTSSSSSIDNDSLEFIFSSGVGGWCTLLTLNSDLSFTGQFHDTDMGDSDDSYPNGTVYFCEFTGRFKNAVKVNEYTYNLTLDSVKNKNEVGETEIKDGLRYIYEDPYGLTGGIEFVLYTPSTPVLELSEEIISWNSYYFEDERDTLGCYIIYNKSEELPFFSE
ncbi:MAG: hypothetical protein IJ462_00625 [Clostridia bacterium]|nr:hypothetical protein [Clostridia bacterium]